MIGLTTLLALVGCGFRTPKDPDSADSGRPGLIASTLNCNKLVHYVRPSYPKEARTMHIQGTVEVRATITKTGDLRNIEVLKGDPLLVPAALTAVTQWRYSPCQLNGEAVDVATVLEVSFNLGR
jgi:TonB family protein